VETTSYLIIPSTSSLYVGYQINLLAAVETCRIRYASSVCIWTCTLSK